MAGGDGLLVPVFRFIMDDRGTTATIDLKLTRAMATSGIGNDNYQPKARDCFGFGRVSSVKPI